MLLLFEASGENLAFCSDPSVTSAQALMEALLSRHFWVLDLMGRFDGFICFNNPGYIQSVSWPRFLHWGNNWQMFGKSEMTTFIKVTSQNLRRDTESLNAAVFHFICRSDTQTYILWTHCVLAATLQQYGTLEKNSRYMLIIILCYTITSKHGWSRDMEANREEKMDISCIYLAQ